MHLFESTFCFDPSFSAVQIGTNAEIICKWESSSPHTATVEQAEKKLLILTEIAQHRHVIKFLTERKKKKKKYCLKHEVPEIKILSESYMKSDL